VFIVSDLCSVKQDSHFVMVYCRPYCKSLPTYHGIPFPTASQLKPHALYDILILLCCALELLCVRVCCSYPSRIAADHVVTSYGDCVMLDAHTRTHTHTWILCRTTYRMSQHQRGKTGMWNQSGFTGARYSEWQWHQLGHVQICTFTQTQPRQHHTTQFITGWMPMILRNTMLNAGS